MMSENFKLIRERNPEMNLPENAGKFWSDEEEKQLLEEIANNVDFETIAKNHGRTIRGIDSRRREVAFKMFVKECSIEAIMEITKLSEEEINLTINKKQGNIEKKSKKELKQVETKQVIKNDEIQLLKSEVISMKSDIVSMRNEIFELKKTINSLAEMLKLVYEFESEQ